MSLYVDNGALLRLKRFMHEFDRVQRASFRAPKGKVFVALLIGVEDEKGGEPLDIKAAMHALGWSLAPDLTPEEREGAEKLLAERLVSK